MSAHYTPGHAKPRSVLATRIALAFGALLVIVTLGFAGYATGAALTSHPAPSVHECSCQHLPAQPYPPHLAPAPHHPGTTTPTGPGTAPGPAPGPHAAVAHHLHVLHLHHLHVLHLLHLAMLGVALE